MFFEIKFQVSKNSVDNVLCTLFLCFNFVLIHASHLDFELYFIGIKCNNINLHN